MDSNSSRPIRRIDNSESASSTGDTGVAYNTMFIRAPADFAVIKRRKTKHRSFRRSCASELPGSSGFCGLGGSMK
jgi:hypothetical protein